MHAFDYEGLDPDGVAQTGTIEAADVDAARAKLLRLHIKATALTASVHSQARQQSNLSDPLMRTLSPRIQPPASFASRRFSFSVEFYGSLRTNHQRLIAMFCRLFPSPLTVTTKALERSGLSGERSRGGVVMRDGVEGRLIGRHPDTGAPVVAWDQGAFAAMCESFDDENAARIVSWRSSSERLAFSSSDCSRAALWMDRGLRVVSWGGGAMAVISMALLSLVAGGGWPGLSMMLIPSILTGGMVGLSMLLLIGVPALIMMRLGASLSGLGVGLWASRAHRAATVTDEAGRLSAAAIIASMQGSPARKDAKPAVRPAALEGR